MLPPEATPDARNVRFRGGVVFKRLGYSVMTSASVASGIASGVTSYPMLGDDFARLSGTVTALLATVSGLYKWSGGKWVAIKTGLSGSVGGYHSACIMNDTWIYTNGVDNVQVWTGTGDASDLTGGTDYQTPNTHICRAVIAFSDRLLLLGTNEDGTAYPYRVRWGELGKTGEFNEAEGGGYYDLLEDPSGIQGAELLSDYCAIYCGGSIWMAAYVGAVTFEGNVIPYRFNRVVPNTGTRAPRTIVDIGNEHIFMGEDDIYRFNGSSIIPIGEPVRDELFRGVARKHHIRCFGALNRDENLYHLYIPYGDADGNITRSYIYDYQEGTWSMDSVARLTCAAALQLGSKVTIDDLTGIIDNLQGTIDELGGQEDRRLRIFGDSAGHVFQEDGQTIDDAGTAVDGYWDSIDLTLDAEYVDNYKRVQEILFEARGSSVDVWYSTDHGDTWTLIDTQTLASENARYRMTIDTTCRQLRLRFQNNTSNERFWLRWIGVKFMRAGER